MTKVFIKNKIIMFKQQQYDEIFSHRLTNQNIDIIKKFFVFQPGSQTTNKPYSCLMNKIKQQGTGSPKKQTLKFPGGFQPASKSVPTGQEQQQQRSSFVLQSKKAPTNSISSFLLGLTGRINRESEKKLAEQPQQSPQKKINYEQVMANLNKIRRQNRENRNKYASMIPAISTTNSHTLSNPTELPLLQKRLTSPDRKSTASNSFTPTLSNKSTTPSYSSAEHNKERRTQKNGLLNSNRAISISYSSKMMSPLPEQPTFMKGYLSYEPEGKQILDKYQENSSCEARIKKHLHSISAKNYLVIDRENLIVVAQRNCEQQIQIASLTKIMTCYLCLLACRKYKIQPKQVQVRVSERAEQMPGTSAELQAGDIVTLKDLLYGLMLPSGNDASVAIAETVGKIIQKNKKKPSKKTYFETFVFHMNLLAKQIGIQQNYQNTSGLSFNPNLSSPKAVTVLTAIALRNPQFFQIINCKQYQIEIRNERYGLVRKQMWKNTNKLLWKGWQGVKTGTTESAGHCLMSCKGKYIISVFNCQTLNKRFSQCVKIYEQISLMPDFCIMKIEEAN